MHNVIPSVMCHITVMQSGISCELVKLQERLALEMKRAARKQSALPSMDVSAWMRSRCFRVCTSEIGLCPHSHSPLVLQYVVFDSAVQDDKGERSGGNFLPI